MLASVVLTGIARLAAQSLPSGLTEREVTVPGPVPLPGTLTIPAGRGPFPALSIVDGSGAGDRDLTMGTTPPCLAIRPQQRCEAQAPRDPVSAILAMVSRAPLDTLRTLLIVDTASLRSVAGLDSAGQLDLAGRLPRGIALGVPSVRAACAPRIALRCLGFHVSAYQPRGRTASIRGAWYPVVARGFCSGSYEATFEVDLNSPKVLSVTEETFGSCGSLLIDVRHARETPAPGFHYMEFAYPGLAGSSLRGLYVENRTIMSEHDFREVRAGRSEPEGFTLDVKLTPEGAARMVRETAANLGQYLAVLIEPGLISAARLQAVVGRDPDLPIFMGFHLPEEVVTELITRFRLRWPQ